MREIYSGQSKIQQQAVSGPGELVDRDGQTFYKITNYHSMRPFFITLVSGSDHWMFVSSTGGLTCGRRNPENALFPYYTDDKIHDAHSTTGPHTAILAERDGKTFLWKPFACDTTVYAVERNLYKNQPGTVLLFEEVNHDLGLEFTYSWSSSERFGFVRKSVIRNMGSGDCQVKVLDGLRNLLPYGVNRESQTSLSTLVDAYKQAESIPELSMGIHTLSSILTDRAEPSEALKATVTWSMGLDRPKLLLSEDQFAAFCAGDELRSESFKKGQRGAFYVHSSLELPPGSEKSWYLLSDINQGPSDLARLSDEIGQGIAPGEIEKDIEAGTRRLLELVGSADGCQYSSDALVTARHFSNTLFNIMRGGTFYRDYEFPLADFIEFVGAWNTPLRQQAEALLADQKTSVSLPEVSELARDSGNADLERMALEYLPLIFSRRHGDPSRPWNHFSIDIKNEDGSDKLHYQGNWRDIFQNWEALAISYPEYIENFIAKFVNASTPDGYNPYRISRDGVDWETLEPDNPWSNIGYWGDHQINYLTKLLEFSLHYHPEKLIGFLSRDLFVYANVPYRLKGYAALVNDPRNTVIFDDEKAAAIDRRVAQTGSDGKLLTLADGVIYKVSLLEKLLVSTLSKLGNLVPGGGIWMNTQRPEWNDANNALVGYGLSMVTLCYLRRFLVLLEGLLDEDTQQSYSISFEVLDYFRGLDEALKKHGSMLENPMSGHDRKVFMDELGELGENYRETVYTGFCGRKDVLEKSQLLSFIRQALKFLDHTIAANRRADGLFHSYNLIEFGDERYDVEYLYEMLEGQVAVLSSGFLKPGESLKLLDALKASSIYREDQNSYLLYPDKKLPLFLEKNVIDKAIIESSEWLRRELASGRSTVVEQDANGKVHFNGRFRNAGDLRAALEKESGTSQQDVDALCEIFDEVFDHRRFTGRSGSMYKYEGLGSIYWHMVSKLVLAAGEVIGTASDNGLDEALIDRLAVHFDEIKDGLGLHKTPALYGAFPIDPYSHTPSFCGVQQPGMTGQVKEDVISRFSELGVKVRAGEIEFAPIILKREEFTTHAVNWTFQVGGEAQFENLQPGSMAFTLCGVPVIYRLAESCAITVITANGDPIKTEGSKLDVRWSRSLFERDGRVRKLVVDIPETTVRQ
ncbi:MAG: hypothetical protein HKN57_06850 [Xanthomonadales bacterium]|nr:hypothetical protein [Xanthomonadales bacterium]